MSGSPRSPHETAPDALSVIRVLLAEDDPRDAFLATERLKAAGLNIAASLVSSQEDFVQALDTGEFDLVLSDFQIPGFSGVEALRLTRAHPSSLPFVFVSGVLGEEHAVDMLKQGATDYVLKQRLERLPIAVLRALDEARAARARREAAELLKIAKEQAEAANRAKDRFLAVLSHELRTPLGPIYAAAQALDLRQDMPAECRRSVELIKRNVEVEARLIDDLLDISKIVNDKLSLELTPTDLAGLLRAVVEAFREEAAARGIDLRYAPPAQPLVVRADPARMQQIFWNLLKNALKFTPHGGRIEVFLRRPAPGKIAVDVADTGIGIPPQSLRRIFNAFDQGEESDDPRMHGGLGLGLAIASSLAQRHGGTLGAHSAGTGLGSTFTLTLDDPAASAAPSFETPLDTPPATPARSGRILLVEDNADTAEAMQMLLTSYGYAVDVATSVATAAALIDASRYDALVSDLGLPDGDGIDVLRRYAPGPGQLAVVLTGYGMERDARRCLAAGFSEHLTKPLDITRLLHVLRRHLPGR